MLNEKKLENKKKIVKILIIIKNLINKLKIKIVYWLEINPDTEF